MVYKPTYNWGAPSCSFFALNSLAFFEVLNYQCLWMNLTMTSSRDVTEMMVDFSKIYPLAMTNSLPWEMARL